MFLITLNNISTTGTKNTAKTVARSHTRASAAAGDRTLELVVVSCSRCSLCVDEVCNTLIDNCTARVHHQTCQVALAQNLMYPSVRRGFLAAPKAPTVPGFTPLLGSRSPAFTQDRSS